MSYWSGPQPPGLIDPTWHGQWDRIIDEWWRYALFIHMGGALP